MRRTFRSEPRVAAALLTAAALCGCAADPAAPDPAPQSLSVTPDVRITKPPYSQVHVEWKERLDQAYVYVEHQGDYRRIGSAIDALLREAELQRLQPTGPVFALFFDDPGATEVLALRSRACLPVAGSLRVKTPLAYEVLPGAPVIYAVVAGPYSDVSLSYPALGKYLADRGWVESGPWREIYLNAGQVGDLAELLTEVQVPWRTGG
jgi:effector-binding domain-containing protein